MWNSSTFQGLWSVFKGFSRQILFSRTFQDCPSFSSTFQACANPGSTKQADHPPTGISGCGKIGSRKGWLSKHCGRRGKFRGGELLYVATTLRKVLFCIQHTGLWLILRPVRLFFFFRSIIFGCLGFLNGTEAEYDDFCYCIYVLLVEEAKIYVVLLHY